MNEEKNRELFERSPVTRAVRKMAVPTVFGQLIVLIYSIADTFFVGRTGNANMVSATSLILPLFNIAIPISSLTGVGGSALISRLFGEHKTDEARKVNSFSIYLSVLLALLFSTGVFVFMEPLLGLLGAEKASLSGSDTYTYARTYAMCVVVAGALPTVMTNVFSNLVRSIGESRKAGFGVTLGGIINIALDPLFMFVLFPKGNEVLGAGVATLLSNCISCTYFLIVILRMDKSSILRPVSPKNLPTKASMGKLFVIGGPAAIVTLLFDLDYMVIDKLMSGYMPGALSAIGIVLKAERLPLNVGIGICQGMVPIVAYNYSSKNYARMQKISRFSLLCGIVCAVVSIALYETFAPYIMQFFLKKPSAADLEKLQLYEQTIRLGVNFLRIRCLATFFMFACFYHVHLFNGYGRGLEALFLGVCRWAVFNIPLLFLLNALFGMYGIVWTQLIADILTVLVSIVVHRRFMKKHLQMSAPPMNWRALPSRLSAWFRFND